MARKHDDPEVQTVLVAHLKAAIAAYATETKTGDALGFAQATVNSAKNGIKPVSAELAVALAIDRGFSLDALYQLDVTPRPSVAPPPRYCELPNWPDLLERARGIVEAPVEPWVWDFIAEQRPRSPVTYTSLAELAVWVFRHESTFRPRAGEDGASPIADPARGAA